MGGEDHPVSGNGATVAPLLIRDAKTDDWYYTGPYFNGVNMALDVDRCAIITRYGGRYRVSLCSGPDLDVEEEWGSGDTLEEAWRFALGAYFGAEDWDVSENDDLRALLMMYGKDVSDGCGR